MNTAVAVLAGLVLAGLVFAGLVRVYVVGHRLTGASGRDPHREGRSRAAEK